MPSIDYIRLATWNADDYPRVMSRIMRSWENGWEQGKWLQYKGWRKEGVFIGVGEQNGRRHAVICASGGLAHRLFSGLKNLQGWYCTRLDLQETIVEPEYVKLSSVREDCHTKNTSLIESNENDTLYLGSRTSEIFTRLYEKPLDIMMLRLEFEIKGSRSKMAWQALLKKETVASIFSFYLDASKLPIDILDLFRDQTAESTKATMRAVESHDIGKTWKWLESLDATMEKNMANHEIGEQVKSLVRSWANFADNLDIISRKRIQ